MIVYFTASIVGKKHFMKQYQDILSYLHAHSHRVISDHIINSTEDQIRMETKKERVKFQSQLEKWIQGCDFVIAETSFPSISVGYEISLAVYYNKPVLILYTSGSPPSLIAHHKNDNVICEKYSAVTLKPILHDFIRYVRGIDNARFTFFLTPKITSYLELISRKRKIPKSVYLRQLIEADMRVNPQ